ncbi:MAG: methylated-DNA--[protein]-cysteine S-methyltransferase [Acidimicrobiales bacterium]|nr:methylated-DNA--[protein]-cysteine S-methyltransferase [Acidimicrobiales bacterium]MXX44486.1 methylated-DNA--[protein]-cysteine S-methyltransferase [Acidimicrobiales bacterium]MYB81169.1 methylated-DNA--[protein]-cysteine S-methyltransferase [Acidimicrobiales bacterium]MYD33783.1 methylated-DNA--[protein]-cysteine S-methyltransferase [Acidimicrobiales bacterium]MYI10512.1 methylated-DNA--[protein]-cysteine S-methyltransferase [Acidimicrobiales bacterium]
MSTDTHWHTTVDSPIGPLGLVATDAGLRAVSWRGDETSVKLPDDMVEDPDHPILRLAAHQLGEYFDGDRTSFDLPLDLRGTPFQEAAWRALGDIPYGSTRSYGEQAALIGRPKAVRAVGQANGRNPVPIVLPCHRVIGANGSLTGFGGGLDLKTQLLTHEGAL